MTKMSVNEKPASFASTMPAANHGSPSNKAADPKFTLWNGVKSQILAVNPRARVYGDCPGSISDVTIHSNSQFFLGQGSHSLSIVDSEICPTARIHVDGPVKMIDARIHGTIRGGEVKNSTIRKEGTVNGGFASDADIYGTMNGGFIHKSTICKDGSVESGQSFQNQNIGNHVPLHRQIKDTIRRPVYSFFKRTEIGKGEKPEALPAYPEEAPQTALSLGESSSAADEKKGKAALPLHNTKSVESLPAYDGPSDSKQLNSGEFKNFEK